MSIVSASSTTERGAIIHKAGSSVPKVKTASDMLAGSNQQDVAKLIGPMLRMPGALREGSVYIVGIGRFREKLGANWTRYQTRIYEAIENTIEAQLDPRDVYMRAGEESYVISFASPDMAQSAIKAALVARKIKEKLFGQSDIEAELHLLGEEALKAARERAAAADAKGGAGTAQGKAAECEFTFMPLWDALNKVLSTYVCMPMIRQRSGRMQIGGDQLALDASEIEWAEFNVRTIEYATDVVDELFRNQFAVFVSVHCDYKSFGSARSREILLNGCRKIPEPLRKFMLVHIKGADANVPTSTLTERVNAVKPYFRFASLQVMSLDQPLSRFAFVGLNHLSYMLEPGALVDLKKIAHFVREARAARLLTSIGRISDIATADKIASLGTAYLGGAFLGEALEMPSNMMRCTLDELGRRKLN